MNLDDIVPPLELCKLIPVGEFEDSVFIWGYSCNKMNTEPFVDERDCVEYCRKNMVNAPSMFPAPTLEEIIRKIRLDLLCGIEHHGDFYVSNRHIGVFEDERAATAAIKLWLKLKGIEDGK